MRNVDSNVWIKTYRVFVVTARILRKPLQDMKLLFTLERNDGRLWKIQSYRMHTIHVW